MTKKQKFIASCGNPYYGGYAAKEEVKEAKKLAKGKYWLEAQDGCYCSFSPGGLRRHFMYGETEVSNIDLQNNVFKFLNSLQRTKARQCAKLWSSGFCKEAKMMENFD